MAVIGLIVGGIVAGKTIIHNAELRATIAQVHEIQVAARSFRERFGYLPGDIPTDLATRLNLSKTPFHNTAGNGDGLISKGPGGQNTFAYGEANLFWIHLSEKQLIGGSYRRLGNADSANANNQPISAYLPAAKIGGGMHFNVWNGGPDPCRTASTCAGTDGFNYLSLSEVRDYFDYNISGTWRTYDTLPVIDAFHIDSKLDDGVPQHGQVLAIHLQQEAVGTWAGGEYSGAGRHTWKAGTPTTQANAAGSTNCYDNGGVAGQNQRYTLSLNGGANQTCALSFRFP